MREVPERWAGPRSAPAPPLGCGAVPTGPTYYTIATAPFFPGLVALLNSLRLSGNDGELVVLDRGLQPGQRARLERHARVVDLPSDEGAHPQFLKAYAHVLEPRGVVVVIDSDI